MPEAGKRGTFPRSIELCEKGIYLPSYIGMESATIRRVVEQLARMHT
jgi:dTDP-4-amino-4,6-dideoxygalactose transaminase